MPINNANITIYNIHDNVRTSPSKQGFCENNIVNSFSHYIISSFIAKFKRCTTIILVALNKTIQPYQGFCKIYDENSFLLLCSLYSRWNFRNFADFLFVFCGFSLMCRSTLCSSYLYPQSLCRTKLKRMLQGFIIQRDKRTPIDRQVRIFSLLCLIFF